VKSLQHYYYLSQHEWGTSAADCTSVLRLLLMMNEEKKKE